MTRTAEAAELARLDALETLEDFTEVDWARMGAFIEAFASAAKSFSISDERFAELLRRSREREAAGLDPEELSDADLAAIVARVEEQRRGREASEARARMQRWRELRAPRKGRKARRGLYP